VAALLICDDFSVTARRLLAAAPVRPLQITSGKDDMSDEIPF